MRRLLDSEPVHRREQLLHGQRRVPPVAEHDVAVDHGHAATALRGMRARPRAERLEPRFRDEREVVEREAFGAGRREPLDIGRELRAVGRPVRRDRARSAGEGAQPVEARDQLVAAKRTAAVEDGIRSGDRLGRDALDRRLLRRAGGEHAEQAALLVHGGRGGLHEAPRTGGATVRELRDDTRLGGVACAPPRPLRTGHGTTSRSTAAGAVAPPPRPARAQASTCTRAPRRGRTRPRGRRTRARAARRRRPPMRRRTRPLRGRTGRGCGRPASRRGAAPPRPGVRPRARRYGARRPTRGTAARSARTPRGTAAAFSVRVPSGTRVP